ncbi:ATP-binding protein [Sphaerisporangium sp. NBC_01403]|uniref:ATP-binding protein n=1 Tax=Sphaerisporangium sp. NBC_01403 TaxID=2903599 RepID=UPI003244902D
MPPADSTSQEPEDHTPDPQGRPEHPDQEPSADDRDIRVLVRILPYGSAARRARTVIRDVLQQAGLARDAVIDAEIIVGELAANAERHARQPYELRVFHIGGVPTWCEVVDGDPEPEKIRHAFQRLSTLPEPDLSLLAENGRGLLMTYELSQGHCQAYRTTTITTDAPAKAVAFALPNCSGHRAPLHSLPDLRPGLARLRQWAQHPRCRAHRSQRLARIDVLHPVLPVGSGVPSAVQQAGLDRVTRALEFLCASSSHVL